MTHRHGLRRALSRPGTAVLVGLILLGVSAFAARLVRRRLLTAGARAAGLAAYNRRDYPAAGRHWTEYLDERPDDAGVLEKFAEANLAVRPLQPRHLRAARRAYRRLVRLTPDNCVPYERLMQLCGGAGDYEELAYVATKRLQRNPGDVQASVWRAGALMTQGKTGSDHQAEMILRQVVQRLRNAFPKDPQYACACRLLSDLAMRRGPGDPRERVLEAKGCLDRAVRYDPEQGEGYIWRAHFLRTNYARLGLTETEATRRIQADLRRAEQCRIESPIVLLALVRQWAQSHQLDRAEAALRRASGLTADVITRHFIDPDDWVIMCSKQQARLAILRGDKDRCAMVAEQIVAAASHRRLRFCLLDAATELYALAGRAAQAEQCLKDYLDILPRLWRHGVTPEKLARLRALVARAKGNFYRVAEAIEPVILKNVSDQRLWRLLAEAYAQTNQSRRAVHAMKEYLRLVPDDPDVARRLARQYAMQRDWPMAHEAAARAELLNQPDIDLKLLRIRTAIESAARSGPDGRVWLESLGVELVQLREQHPKLLAVRILQSAIACYQNRWEEAERILARAIKECTSTLPAEMQLARLFLVRGRSGDAIDISRRASQRYPHRASPYLSLGQLQRAAGRKKIARATLEGALRRLEVRREKRRVAIALGLYEIADGERDAGVKRLRQLADKDDRDLYVRSLMLRVARRDGDGIDRQGLVDEIRSLQGESGLLWRFHQASLWASSEAWSARATKIAQTLRHCIDTDPGWSALALLLAEMYERTSQHQEAEKMYLEAFLRDPSCVATAKRLVKLLVRGRAFERAREVVMKLEFAGEGGSPAPGAWRSELLELRSFLASAAWSTGEEALAEELYRETLRQDPNSLRAINDLAWILAQRRGRCEDALRLAERGLQVAPTNPHLRDTREMILSKLLSDSDRSQRKSPPIP